VASRVTGSSDLFGRRGRRPWASINFVTAHDGFSLRDLVSYDHKHNEANGEENRDGTDANHSWNCGADGPSDDPAIRRLRLLQQRNLLTTLLVSQGIPMLVAGDELGRTQGGNNNAYCQDNEVSWLDWDLDAEGRSLLEFTRRLVHLRRDHIVFHRHRFFRGLRTPDSDIEDIVWLRSDGHPRQQEDWEDPESRYVAFVLSGEAFGYHLTASGEPESDQTFLVILNAQPEPLAFRLPPRRLGTRWQAVLDTTVDGSPPERVYADGESLQVEGRSVLLLVRCEEELREPPTS
jgi:glycogen operon protein